jgi:hypothetical protein
MSDDTPLAPRSLWIGDLSFVTLALRTYAEAGVSWLTRAAVPTVLDTADGQRWTVPALLATQPPTTSRVDLHGNHVRAWCNL